MAQPGSTAWLQDASPTHVMSYHTSYICNSVGASFSASGMYAQYLPQTPPSPHRRNVAHSSLYRHIPTMESFIKRKHSHQEIHSQRFLLRFLGDIFAKLA